MTQIVSAFPGTGKSHFFRTHEASGSVLDSDSSDFSWTHVDGEKVRNPEFPANYMQHIAENIGHASVILVSSHEEVRDALVEEGHDFTLVHPAPELRDEYMDRFRDRGSPDAFIDFIDSRWDEFIEQLQTQVGCTTVQLEAGQFISDIIEL